MDDIVLRQEGDPDGSAPATGGGESPATTRPRPRTATRKAAPTARPRAVRSGNKRLPRVVPPEPAAEAPESRRAEARARNAAAGQALDALNRLLERALAERAGASERGAARPAAAPFAGERPRPPVPPATPPAPDPDHPRYRPAPGLLGRLLPGVRRARIGRAEEAFRRDYTAWAGVAERAERDHADALRRHAERLAAWESGRRVQTDAVRRLCARVLAPRADDPACLPHGFEVGHEAGAGVTVVDYRLPRPEDLPSLRRVRYVRTRDAIEEVHLKPEERDRLYDDVVCQLALRALHGLFEADAAGLLGAVVFNGWIGAAGAAADGPGGGRPARACILSVRVERRAFRALDLTKADPWACYRALNGVGGARPHRLVPVAPLAAGAGESAHESAREEAAARAPADIAPQPAPAEPARLALAAT